MQEKSLKHRLMIIVSYLFVLPSLVVCYIFYDKHVTLSLSHVALFFLILVLAIIGIILVRYVFDAVSTTADFLKKATEGGEKLSLNLHHETAELNEISSSFNRMIERFEKTTESLNQAKEALHESEEKYRNILENIEDGYYEVDLSGNFTFVNSALSQILGYSIEELNGMNNRHYMDEENAKKALHAFNEVYQTGISKKHLDGELIRKDRNKVFVETSVSLIRDPQGQPMGFYGIIHDITERKRTEEGIIALSNTDHLTGLHNRRGFITLAEQQLKIQEQTRHLIMLLYADLDHMKWINDTLGHEKGDKALIEVASILKDVFRKSDIIARVGGDEFAVLGIVVSTRSWNIIESRLQHQLDIHNAIENRDYKIFLSVGTAFSDPESPYSIDELMSLADAAMYEHKRSKRS
jgi:diguanylate cyclase (GGDEF)-like protein/PAS domain S-box-containing protein